MIGRENIVELSPGRYASYRGTHQLAAGDLDFVICVRRGELPERPRLPRRTFADLPPKIHPDRKV